MRVNDHGGKLMSIIFPGTVSDCRVLQMRESSLQAILRHARRLLTKQMGHPVIA